MIEKIMNGQKNVIVTGNIMSGKTTNILFPFVDKIIENKENLIIYDVKREYINTYYEKLKNSKYDVKIINLRDLKHSENWNPLDKPYLLYKMGMQDIAIEELKAIANALYPVSNSQDPFWPEMASNYFISLCLGLFEDANDSEEVNFSSIGVFNTYGDTKSGMNTTHTNDYLRLKPYNSPIYAYASSIINAPLETKGSILSVVKKSILSIIGNPMLINMLSKSTFNYHDIVSKPTAIFVIGKPENKILTTIASMFFNQMIQFLTDNKSEIRCNIILDDFDNLDIFNNFKDYLKLNNFANVRYIISTYSIEDLNEKYQMKIQKLSDIIKINNDSIELECSEKNEVVKKDFHEVKITSANIEYPQLKMDTVKMFDLKKYINILKENAIKKMINGQGIKPFNTDGNKPFERTKEMLADIKNDVFKNNNFKSNTSPKIPEEKTESLNLHTPNSNGTITPKTTDLSNIDSDSFRIDYGSALPDMRSEYKKIKYENGILTITLNGEDKIINDEKCLSDFKIIIDKYKELLVSFSEKQHNMGTPDFEPMVATFADVFSGNIDGKKVKVDNTCRNQEMKEFYEEFRKEMFSKAGEYFNQ